MKVRGHRIEPGEVEVALLDLGSLQDAVVVAPEDEQGEPRLVAYVVPGQRARKIRPLTVSALRRDLAGRLPAAMIPSAFVLMETLPRTVTGKVDRRALPPPSPARPALDTAFAAPRTPIEEILVGIWAEVLGLDAVGIHDRFFELGGNSTGRRGSCPGRSRRLGSSCPCGPSWKRRRWRTWRSASPRNWPSRRGPRRCRRPRGPGMKRIRTAALVCLALLGGAGMDHVHPAATAGIELGSAEGWKLVWADEFDKDGSLDEQDWTLERRIRSQQRASVVPAGECRLPGRPADHRGTTRSEDPDPKFMKPAAATGGAGREARRITPRPVVTTRR